MKYIGCLFLLILQLSAQTSFLRKAAERSAHPEDFEGSVCPYSSDKAAARVLREYGAVFVSGDSVAVPVKCVFGSSTEVRKFQDTLKLASARFENVEIELQTEALRALLKAVNEVREARLEITPLDGSIAGTRTYEDTVRLWNSRFYRGLDHWQRRGQILKADADSARALPPFEQVAAVLNWEERGLWFSTGLNRSILTSVAAPGTSQHLSGLAFDVIEYRNRQVRAILNKNGWYQTVVDDEPHFTYLGYKESDLPKYGLISKSKNGYKFWIPKIP